MTALASTPASQTLTHGSLVVVKLGGRPLESAEGRARLAQRLAALQAAGARLVLVHGGGVQVTDALKAAGVEAQFVNGLRVTDDKVLAVAEPVFAHVGKVFAHALSVAGAPAVALTGRDALLVRAVVKDAKLGRVGTVTHIETDLLRHLAFNGITPLVGPIAVDDFGALNVNADEVAAAVAAALGARELMLLTDVPGVRGADGATIATLTPALAQGLISDGVATGGMVPKINGALEAVGKGVGRVRVLDEAGLDALAAGLGAGTVFLGEKQ